MVTTTNFLGVDGTFLGIKKNPAVIFLTQAAMLLASVGTTAVCMSSRMSFRTADASWI